MKIEIQQKLLRYYYHSKVNSYIFSSDINSKLKKYDITKTDWFYILFSEIINTNKEFEILSEKMKGNCYVLLNRFRNSNKSTSENINKCNDLTRKLNTSGTKHSYDYLISLYLTSSFNEQKSEKS